MLWAPAGVKLNEKPSPFSVTLLGALPTLAIVSGLVSGTDPITRTVGKSIVGTENCRIAPRAVCLIAIACGASPG